MSNSVRCKMLCNSFTGDEETNAVVFTPVVSGSTENETFFKYTPAGKLELSLVNREIEFEPGKEYYVDITTA